VTGPAQELGRVAVGQIMRRITAATPADELVLLTPVLTVRQSTGPAPQQGAQL
jgi:DNA-binding LacI/PurR family transcriptional regulator